VNAGRETGASLVELLVTVALIATVAGLAAPLVVHARDDQEGRSAATFLAGHFRLARQQAIQSGRNTALVFDLRENEWTFVVCADGDADGVSRADISAGIDPCRGAAQPLASWFSRTSIHRASAVPDLSGNTDGAVVAFGTARMASFSPLGTASSGSVTIMTRGGRHFAVRIAGVTGRVRIWRFLPESRRWQEW
jgi:type II secretory pathway pseudopilin PulG